MRILKLLLTVLIALALSMTLGCTADKSGPAPAAGGQKAVPSPGPPAGASPAAGDASIRISGDYSRRTSDCTGRDVSIEGQANTIVLTGTCETITVGGRFNTVDVEAADTIKITGNSSTVNAEILGAVRLDGAYFVTVNWVNGAGGSEPTVSGTGRAYTVNKISRQDYESRSALR
ncbi:DUF3060 domain-containing protein [Streptomyces sp. NPDC002143]